MIATDDIPYFVICDGCQCEFELDFAQKTFIKKLKDKGAPFVMVKCQKCWRHIKVKLNEYKKKEMWKCPVSQCDGWVVQVNLNEKYIDGGLQWACGECGSFWRKKENLLKEIMESIEKFPYRSVYYNVKDGIVKPSELSDLPDNSKKIESEPDDVFHDYERG